MVLIHKGCGGEFVPVRLVEELRGVELSVKVLRFECKRCYVPEGAIMLDIAPAEWLVVGHDDPHDNPIEAGRR